MVAYRRFSAEIEALARAWSTSAVSTDTWTPTGRSWGTNSNPIMVANQNALQGVAKPGSPRPDKVLRAANEKICSDLAYVLNLPIPPVTLWDRGEGFVGERYCCISAWAFAQCVEWPAAVPKLSPAQLAQAGYIAGAMKVFDTWTASSDRKNDHVLVADDGDASSLGLAYIDYAFSLSYEWGGGAGPQPDPRPHWPSVAFEQQAVVATITAIEGIHEQGILEIVRRVPVEYLPDGVKTAIQSQLLGRRPSLRRWFGI